MRNNIMITFMCCVLLLTFDSGNLHAESQPKRMINQATDLATGAKRAARTDVHGSSMSTTRLNQTRTIHPLNQSPNIQNLNKMNGDFNNTLPGTGGTFTRRTPPVPPVQKVQPTPAATAPSTTVKRINEEKIAKTKQFENEIIAKKTKENQKLQMGNQQKKQKLENLANDINEFAGGKANVVRSDSKAFVAVGNNSNKVRIDFDGHGYKPHAHLEVKNSKGEYTDAPGTPHHIFFKKE